jgi:hypothetical protein
MLVDRKIIESPLTQGVDEQIAYVLDTTPWGGTPTSPSVVAKDSNGTDQSGTVLSGSATVSGDDITSPSVQSLTDGEHYRIEWKFTISGNVLEAWMDLVAEQ